MSDIAATVSSFMAMSQARMQDQISLSILKMNAQADQALVDIITRNARQIQALSNNTSGHIDLFI